MSKSLSRNLYLVGLFAILVAIVLSLVAAGQTTTAADGTAQISTTGGIIGLVSVVLDIVGAILLLVAWVGALVKTAQLGRWGWFVCLIVFSGITMLIYIFAGPETSKVAVPANVG